MLNYCWIIFFHMLPLHACWCIGDTCKMTTCTQIWDYRSRGKINAVSQARVSGLSRSNISDSYRFNISDSLIYRLNFGDPWFLSKTLLYLLRDDEICLTKSRWRKHVYELLRNLRRKFWLFNLLKSPQHARHFEAITWRN